MSNIADTSSGTSLTGRTPGRSAQPLANKTTSSKTSSVIPSRNFKRQESGPALAPSELTLSQISTGVGVAPSIEVRNGDIEGFDARDSADVDWLVMLYRPPLQDRTVDNTSPPLTLSMERKSIGADGYSVETLVRHFEVLSSISDVERDLAARSLDEAANLLRVPESFEQGLVMLEELCGQGVLTTSTFRPVCEQFEAPMSDEPGFNLKDFGIRLKVWLHRHNVPFETWGTGEAKDLDDLARELLSREGALSVEGGEVFLENRVALLWLESPNGDKRLFEDHQRFANGRTRRRGNLGGLPAEKAGFDENTGEPEHPIQVARRLLREELGISRRIEIEREDVSTRIEPSQCYPGILKRNTYLICRATLEERDYRTKYVEHTPKKNTTFRWVNIPTPQLSHEGQADESQSPGAVANAR